MIKLPSHYCPKCGENIGWVGRFLNLLIQDYHKCNLIQLINHNVKYQSFNKGLTNFTLLPFQEELVTKFEQHQVNIFSSSRQSGKSSVPLYYLLIRAIFNPDSNIAIFSFNTPSARDLLEKIRVTYETLDISEYIKVVKCNKDCIELSNGSRIIASNVERGEIFFRGQTFTDVFLDEFSMVNYNIAKKFVGLLPLHISRQSSKLIISGTKRKGSYFNVLLRFAKKKTNPFVASVYNWDVVPGRDEEWKENIISMIGKENFEREYVV